MAQAGQPAGAATPPESSPSKPEVASAPRPRPRPNHEIYALPLPIRTFPLPTFYPTNPVSWVHVLYVWLSQSLRPPPKEPSVLYHGIWDAGTGSVHVWDQKSIRGLWESGFFGKGALSRSEPNWQKRELSRRGAANKVIEQVTVSRREERQRMKWERARIEQEAIEQTKLNEKGVSSASNGLTSKPRDLHAPVGPKELLALPNSLAELVVATLDRNSQDGAPLSLNGNAEDKDLPLPESNPLAHLMNGHANGYGHVNLPAVNGIHVDGLTNGASACNGIKADSSELNGIIATNDETNGTVSPVTLAPSANGYPMTPSRKEGERDAESKGLKRQKSVRFSPKVESTTFQHFDPPSPQESLKLAQSARSNAGGNSDGDAAARPESSKPSDDRLPVPLTSEEPSIDDVPNKEHLQLSPEEAFFLSFSIGALKVVDPATDHPLSTSELLALCRSHSYFPPRSLDSAGSLGLRPDDPFLIQYAVYHHFRSMGWIVRHGIKFGADWLLYQR
jgi:tRNA-splicing endonuclease subunit Sen2